MSVGRGEIGASNRDFIHGAELRLRAELGLDPGVFVLVINRPLRATLERMAYSQFTDSLQTSVDSSLTEELRWLEYGQRLVHRKRNVAAWPGRQSATAARLFDAALGAGDVVDVCCEVTRRPPPSRQRRRTKRERAPGCPSALISLDLLHWTKTVPYIPAG